MRRFFQKSSKKNTVLLAFFILTALVAIGIFIWGFKTGRFGFFAAVNCPANTICNQATLTYTDAEGVVRSVDSNIAMIQLESGTTTGNFNIIITLPTFNHNYSTSSVSLKIYPAGQSAPIFEKNDISTDSSGLSQNTVSALVVNQSYDFKLQVPYYLTKILKNVVFSENINVDFGLLKGGDINPPPDDQINGGDFAYLKGKLTTTDSVADINQDGTVNVLDFSFIYTYWGQNGDQ